MNTFSGNIVDVVSGEIYAGTIKVSGGKIKEIAREAKKYKNFLIPGFIDAHIHIESSMLPPAEFARAAVRHGTVGAVADAHEIANVLGIAGVRYMIDHAKKVPFRFYFSAPSCVPATTFETSGAALHPSDIEKLFRSDEIKFLGEVMNYPGVINGDPEVMEKIALAKKYGKLVDGHAPGLRGEPLRKYVAAGISTDHECFRRDEALEKLSLGMKVIIREGSAVKNFDELIPIANEHSENCMLCSDDKHPDDLAESHINALVKRAITAGIPVMKVLRMASLNPVRHYGLDVGLLQKGDNADFLEIDNLEKLNILQTIIGGRVVARKGRTLLSRKPAKKVNDMRSATISAKSLVVRHTTEKSGNIRVIVAENGSLITKKMTTPAKISNGEIIPDVPGDILKLVIVNRYRSAPPAIAFIHNFGLKKGAIASSVAHDSHNIIAVGTNDGDLADAINLLFKNKGGVCAVSRVNRKKEVLPLPIAGLMSTDPFDKVAKKYEKIDKLAKKFGSKLTAPFMTLSFMALLVIPELKLSDKGLFDGTTFTFADTEV